MRGKYFYIQWRTECHRNWLTIDILLPFIIPIPHIHCLPHNNYNQLKRLCIAFTLRTNSLVTTPTDIGLTLISKHLTIAFTAVFAVAMNERNQSRFKVCNREAANVTNLAQIEQLRQYAVHNWWPTRCLFGVGLSLMLIRDQWWGSRKQWRPIINNILHKQIGNQSTTDTTLRHSNTVPIGLMRSALLCTPLHSSDAHFPLSRSLDPLFLFSELSFGNNFLLLLSFRTYIHCRVE